MRATLLKKDIHCQLVAETREVPDPTPEDPKNTKIELSVNSIKDLEIFSFIGEFGVTSGESLPRELVLEGLKNDLCQAVNKGRNQLGLEVTDWLPKLTIRGPYPAGSLVILHYDDIKERCHVEELDYEFI
jgi:hypothetical protein